VKIGLVAPPWFPVPPKAYGGTEAVVANLARGLSERGHEVVLFTVGESTCPVRRRHLFERAVEPLGQSVTEAAHVLAAYDSLTGVDIIHDHTILGPLLAARDGATRVPVVTTNHGPFTELTRPLFRQIARHCAVVAISHDQASRAGAVPIAAVINHGIDLDAYRPGRGQGDFLVFVGRMSPEKGVASAVRIAHAAGRPLRIVSKMREPEEHDYFRSFVRPLLGQDETVEELGLEERARLVGEAAALLNPIAWPEPFGLVMAESLATGTPVLARPEGAAPEIVTPGLTGFLFDSEREAVVDVARLPELSRADCRAEAERRFSLQRMAAAHEALYLSLLDAGRPAPRPPVEPLRRRAARGTAWPQVAAR
jgi:glycosyltransferase involved in cell wall biosynthesis